MKADTKSLLKKINKLHKDQALGNYALKVNEFNEENSKLEFKKQQLQNELIYEKNYDNELLMLNYYSNWKNLFIEQISKQESKILSISSMVEFSRINMEDASKKSVLYDKLLQPH